MYIFNTQGAIPQGAIPQAAMSQAAMSQAEMDKEVLTDRSCDCHLQSNSKMGQIIDATCNYTGEKPQATSHHMHVYI